MSGDLKLCPFCGGKPYEAHHLEYSRWAVTCKCGAHGPNFREDPPNEHKCSAYQKATEAWNARAALAAPKWWKCDTHGPAKAGAWGCPECVREMRDEAADFHMAYRMKCDEETKTQALEIERLKSKLDQAGDDLIEYGQETARVVRDRCAAIARSGCLVLPDGGAPTPEEAALCNEIYMRIMETLDADSQQRSTDPRPAMPALQSLDLASELAVARQEVRGHQAG